ncbi:hypothetical protein HK405_006490, partial [Cladochytrium tenue]
LEAAKAIGYYTGLVATSRITHATPASFSAHVLHRDMEADIAVQQIGNYSLGRGVDLMFGGGRCFFRPAGSPDSCRADALDLIATAQQDYDWTYADGIDEFRQLTTESLPAFSLFAHDHMSYEIDRDPLAQPSLKEMALKAIDLLSSATKRSRKGFFLMIEGSRIDMAAHSNDPAAHVREILAYNEAILAVKNWVAEHPNTVMISVSDHETGGMSVAHQRGSSYPSYKWTPSALVNVKFSTEVMGEALGAFAGADFATFVASVVVPEWLGIADPTAEEVAALAQPGLPAAAYADAIGRILSDRAEIGWATHGHSAVDVNLYAFGLDSFKLRGNHENTDIGHFISGQLKLDLQAITDRLTSEENLRDPATAGASTAPEGSVQLKHFHHPRR